MEIRKLAYALVGIAMAGITARHARAQIVAELLDGTVLATAPAGGDLLVPIGTLSSSTAIRIRDTQAIGDGVPTLGVGGTGGFGSTGMG